MKTSRSTGSFFETVPAGADVYLLSHIIHDWREDLCLTILGHCRRAMNPGGRVLITEMVLPPADTPHPGKMLDVMMLVGPGGQERTAQEYGGFSTRRASSQPDCADGIRRERRRSLRRLGSLKRRIADGTMASTGRNLTAPDGSFPRPVDEEL